MTNFINNNKELTPRQFAQATLEMTTPEVVHLMRSGELPANKYNGSWSRGRIRIEDAINFARKKHIPLIAERVKQWDCAMENKDMQVHNVIIHERYNNKSIIIIY